MPCKSPYSEIQKIFSLGLRFMEHSVDGSFVEENIKFMLSGGGENNELQQLTKLHQRKRIVLLVEI